MKHVIDLVPYLPQQAAQAKVARRRRRFGSVAAAIESLVTLCIGAAFLLFVAAFLAVF